MPEAGRRLVVGIGELLWDMLPGGKQPGGAPANFSCHVRSLGEDALVLSAVGEDALGLELREWCRQALLDPAHITVDPAHPTGTVDVQLDEAGSPTYRIHEDVAWDHLTLTPAWRELADRVDCVCYGTLGRRSHEADTAIQTFLGFTRSNCLRIFDINLRQSYYNAETLQTGLHHASVLKLNDEELPVLADLLNLPGDEDAQLDHLICDYDLSIIALTQGARGSLLATKTERFTGDSPTVTVVDTVGAGDAFTAALAVGLLRDMPLPRIQSAAENIAAFVCTQSGATPSIPASLITGYRAEKADSG